MFEIYLLCEGKSWRKVTTPGISPLLEEGWALPASRCPGAALATGRRQQWGREEEGARRAREAGWRDSARGLVHRGRFWSQP